MLYRRPACPIGDRHALSETDMSVDTHRRPTCLRSPKEFKHIKYLNKLIFIYFLLIYIYWNNLMKHVEVSEQACRSPTGLRQISDGSPICLKLVSDWSSIIIIFFVNSFFVKTFLSMIIK